MDHETIARRDGISSRGDSALTGNRQLTTGDFASFAVRVTGLTGAIEALAAGAQRLGVAPPQGREWFDLLKRKLLPQLEGPPLLIVAVVGGTNIGKSVVFNHLAGETASAATPLAAGTKHPVCLVPPGCDDPDLLGRLFGSFELHPWRTAEDPLKEAPEDRIYRRVGAQTPPRLALVDAPDVDSDVTVNWQRARSIRQTADVLIALLTQQKYNDAAVKQFFRAAVEADKPIIVVFNFCDLQADRDYCPQWLAQFRAETGADPELVYAAPYDRAAADELRLPFYRLDPLHGDVAKDEGGNKHAFVAPASPELVPLRPAGYGMLGKGATPCPSTFIPHPSPFSLHPSSPTDLRNELATLHFDAIKIRTFRGALARVLDPAHGLPGYLRELRAAAAQFAAAVAALSAGEMARIAWPPLPQSALLEEMRQWWDAGRSPWSRRVHGVYRAINHGILWPVRAAWGKTAGPGDDPLAAFQRQEHAAVVMAVEKLFDELDRLAAVGNEILQPRLRRILAGQARSQLLARVEQAHRWLPPVDEDYRAMIRTELDGWKAGFPRFARWLRALDQAMAAARPAVTVTLCVSGGVLVGGLATHVVGHAATQAAADAVITTGVTEAAVNAAGEGARQAFARLFRRLQTRFAEKRARWLADFLEKELLAELLDELRQGAAVPESAEFKRVETTMAQITL